LFTATLAHRDLQGTAIAEWSRAQCDKNAHAPKAELAIPRAAIQKHFRLAAPFYKTEFISENIFGRAPYGAKKLSPDVR
jgi:hypothetical protein